MNDEIVISQSGGWDGFVFNTISTPKISPGIIEYIVI